MNAKPEFSRPVKVQDLKNQPRSYEIKATNEECAALARRFSLIAIERLSANMRLSPQKDGLVRLEGELSAKVTQTCVVTLEPLEAMIETSFTMLHGGGGQDETAGEIELSGDDGMMPDPFDDGAIDLGEAAAEQLALELDPFPRKTGAAFKGYESGGGTAVDETNENRPFTSLAKLIKDRT